MPILVKDIWPIDNLADYKIHFARYNQHSQPLEVWVRSKEEWQGWQEYRPGRDDFNRPLIFSLMQFHYETDIWLFGGVFRVKDRHADRYKVELTELGKEFIGRLKIRSSYRNRTTRTNMERHFPEFEVQEILREPYSGNDLLFAGSGETLTDIGKAVGYRLNGEAYAGGDIVILSLPKEYRADYIAYYLNSLGRLQLNRLGAGHSVVHIYAKDLAKVLVPLPPIKTQDYIVETLKQWDTAIEKTQSLIDAKERQFGWLQNTLIRANSDKWPTKPLNSLSQDRDIRHRDECLFHILRRGQT